MHKSMVFVGFIAVTFSMAASAASISKDGYLGCRTKSDFDSLISAATQNDMESFRALILSRRCVPLTARQRISVVNFSLFGGTEILYQGARLFTVNEAINTKE